ncbi:MAG: hypothetical protein ACYDC1_14950 [Limisphaerales bacterium]
MHSRRGFFAIISASCLAWLTASPLHAAEPEPSLRAAVWLPDVPGGDAVFARELAEQVRDAGYTVEVLDSVTLTNVTRLTTNSFDLLVLPHARVLPVESMASIHGYLRQGGHLLALGLTAWETPTFRIAGEWMSESGYRKALARQKPERLLLDLGGEDLSKWIRHAQHPELVATRELVTESGTEVLRVGVEKLDGWDTLEASHRSWSIEPGQTLTCFRARGSATTRQLSVEWIEADGSRWIATVRLTPDWQDYVLPPDAFKPWQPPAGRGGPEDRLNLTRAERFTIGLAFTHTGVAPGPHEYWFADLGVARNPFGAEVPPVAREVPRLESLSPVYQTYDLTTPVVVRPPRWQAILREPVAHHSSIDPADSFDWPAGLRALHPRPRGVGWRQDRPWRWQPLVTARDPADGDYRGAIAALIVHQAAPFADGVWALWTPTEPAFYRRAETRRWLDRLLRRMARGGFLVEGGAEFFTLFPDQAVRLGARVSGHRRDSSAEVELSLSVLGQRDDRELFQHREIIAPGMTRPAAVETTWKPVDWPEGGAVVAVRMRVDGRVVDELFHELHRWEPPASPAWIEARDGGLWLEGQPWKAHGVNYLPSSGIGVASDYFEHWLGRGAYDPEVIERDLRRIKSLGLNSVSAFIHHRSLDSQHLLDFLLRCERRGLKVNLSLRPGTPMDFRWSEMKAIIERYRLAENDTVMAYDLAWEPSHFGEAHQRRHYPELWNQWVLQRHGSTAAAFKVWNGDLSPALASPPSTVGIPSMAQLLTDGPHRRLVADYRQFLDELVGARYAEARRLVKSIDAHHPVSFRMQHAGDPTLSDPGLLAYDFWGLREAVDLWEPEAYGRVGDWARVRPGHFTAAYARLCDPAKPVVWAEMGHSVWDLNTMAPDPDKLEFAARFYTDFYRMLRESGADGVFFWWYPGGFRLFENSDYGILNPDGTDRSVTRVIRQQGAAFMGAPKSPAPDTWLPVDRDADARGLSGLYEAVQDAYWKIVEDGRTPGLRWIKPPGQPVPRGP